jgi:hypothetical protein
MNLSIVRNDRDNQKTFKQKHLIEKFINTLYSNNYKRI